MPCLQADALEKIDGQKTCINPGIPFAQALFRAIIKHFKAQWTRECKIVKDEQVQALQRPSSQVGWMACSLSQLQQARCVVSSCWCTFQHADIRSCSLASAILIVTKPHSAIVSCVYRHSHALYQIILCSLSPA